MVGVLSDEIDRSVPSGRPIALRPTRWPGPDVPDQDGPFGGPVAAPELPAVLPVVGRERHDVADRGQLVRLRPGMSANDVPHEDGAIGGSVAPPQLWPVLPIVRREVQLIPDRDRAHWPGSCGVWSQAARPDVLQQRRPGRCPITSPELSAVAV